MNSGIPKISVLIVTYKQEELIKRAINSLLAQKDYIYEICVSDDCSPDNTWGILQEYHKQYPGLFKLHRNNRNVGIFENIENTWIMPTGDIIYQLAGDDEVGKDWFKTVIEFVLKNGIKYKDGLFCVYGDYMWIDPAGYRNVHKNDLASTNKNMFSLALRCVVGNRSACYGANVLKKFFKASQGRSHIAESAQDRQLQLFTEKSYYIPQVGNIYYSGIGVSRNIVKESIFIERKQINYYMINRFSEYGFKPKKSDLRYCKYDDAFIEFLHTKTMFNFLKLLYGFILSFDFSIGIRSLNLQFISSHLSKLILHKKDVKNESTSN